MFVLYGEVCDPDEAQVLAGECHRIIMDPANEFLNMRKDACLYGLNSLSFLFHAFRNRRGPVKDYIDDISKKVSDALEQNCHDIAYLAIFAASMPIFSTRY